MAILIYLLKVAVWVALVHLAAFLLSVEMTMPVFTVVVIGGFLDKLLHIQ